MSMVDLFGLCGENANDQGQKSKYQWLHNALDVAGLFFDAANTLDAFSDTMKAVSKWGDNPLKLVDGVTTEAASKALKALETGGEYGR